MIKMKGKNVMKLAKYTEFGALLRRIRVDKQETQKSMATTLGVSTSYLSMIELGKRPIPNGFVEKVSNKYSLAPAERRIAMQAVTCSTATSVFS